MATANNFDTTKPALAQVSEFSIMDFLVRTFGNPPMAGNGTALYDILISAFGLTNLAGLYFEGSIAAGTQSPTLFTWSQLGNTYIQILAGVSTIQIEASLNSSDWFAVEFVKCNDFATPLVSSATAAADIFKLTGSRYPYLRINNTGGALITAKVVQL